MMKHSFLLFCFVWAFVFTTNAQTNYVLNPGFEIYTTCPTALGQIHLAAYWSNLDTMAESLPCAPAFCNACATLQVGVPIGGAWYNHFAHTGSGMVISAVYTDSAFYYPYSRSYMQGRLYKSLMPGQSYCVTYYIALAQESYHASNHNDAYLDDGSIDIGENDTNCGHTLALAQIIDTTVILDTIPGWRTNYYDTTYNSTYRYYWTKIQGNFIATGTERFITIGDFSTIANTTVLHLNDFWGGASEYLFDDVSVVRSDAIADAGPDVFTSLGYPVWIGNDTAAVGGGDGLPCWWYIYPGTGPAIDSGGRIQVSPDTTTTYVMMMDLCGNITYDTVTVWVWPLSLTGNPSPQPSPQMEREVILSPNPLNSLTPTLSINGEGVSGASYQVMNSIGQVLLQGVLLGNKSEVDVRGLLPGVYMINLFPAPESHTYVTGQALSKGEGGIIRKKLVKL